MSWQRFQPPPEYKSDSLSLEQNLPVKYRGQYKYSEEWVRWENFTLPYYVDQRKRARTLPLTSDSLELICRLRYS
jgi:hypothetical protein